YQINADLGLQHGGNLFHSFQDFNLQNHESATFSGPTNVQNIIGRVTGGNSSSIDGTIRSTIPNADLYLLNPYGILFGSNAKLDVQGGFHASTADYLRLQDGGRFEARVPNNSLLTVAPVTAFGFVTDAPAKLSIEGSQLSILEGKTFSLVGGELSIRRGQFLVPQGHFNLVSIAQTGEVSVPDLEVAAIGKQGTISILDHADLNVDGAGGGEIVIRGGQLVVEESSLQANTLAEQNGRGIQLRLTESVQLNGKSAQITSNTFGSGSAGSITVSTPHLTINQGKLLTNSFSDGAAGDVYIDTLQTAIHEGGKILNESHGKGHAGNLTIIAKEGLFIVDKRIFPKRETAEFLSHVSSAAFKEGAGGRITIHASQLVVDGGSIVSHSHTQGDAGEIEVEADSVKIINGGLISATILSQSSGKGGSITFRVKDTIQLSGFRPGFSVTSTDVFENMQSAIAAITFGSGHAGNIYLSAKELTVENQSSIGAATGGVGNAGSLTIEVDNLYLKSGGIITDSSGGIVGGKLFLGTGAGGTAKITARESIVATGRGYFSPSGILSNTLATGQGGNVEIQTNRLYLADGAEISANSLGTGQSGELRIQANTLEIFNRGEITTSAQYAAGGDVHITATNLFYLHSGSITTSVAGGIGDGGDITIDNPQFIVLNQGRIVAQADAGNGGNIWIVADQFIATPESLVSASSNKGISGSVLIHSPDNNIAGNLLTLSKEFKSIPTFSNFCKQKTLEEKDSFKVIQHRQSRPAPEDWQASPVHH
ncbi:MAG: hypothetical protein BWK78_03305, partial [Thiotrichaceae bacterium IS1]